ncbi:LysR family transcriptional regulator [Novacetimonas hansenii]|uniref:HTH-type transcriptional regulator MetR n=2 Tax=Novacetimonas hansenii TaxID=436 RepID=A0ABQ0SC75_NOVHA|nr:LysR family transcriptional regulator [Novacetimonas hansenii]EFG84321.1 transcriptional regulator LysR [Novacetimonas hansenii ATCC 23769]RFP03002.1 LysR family transcriptional regulator [Novacetimonas hansenii]WEQ59575.1 LysR family transcriptional regulator [Novacetimonas hansenii]CUW47127.1 HTH-type transcriptional regulator CynR [Novacetimonas hansenii]GAN82351.1 transcriptional regulator LysR [Novacetimonas hansenii JCM 7643]
MGVLERHHLTIIQEVAREGSLTAAGMRLHLTQPALSHAIRKIENQLDVKIWRREGRSLVLTQAGEWLLSLANRLLPQFELAEKRLEQFSNGERGTLRIGMECHPCYQWLLKVVSPYLERWPRVDVDVRQKFQFGGIGALFSNEIDILVTPDPLYKPGLKFTPVFDYELVLAVGPDHPLRNTKFIAPEQLADETLITYPVPSERLDIYTQFLQPAGIAPRQQKQIETTDIMLVMVAHGRGVAALPRWLVKEYTTRFKLYPVRLGKKGIAKQIFLGHRETDEEIHYLRNFIEFAASPHSKS